jgi:hypothetical protein
LVLAIALGVTGLAYSLHAAFTVDDAAISFSYARNFAQGYGLGALYPGAARVEGYSNLLWVILLAAGTYLGFDTVLVSKILGLTFSLGVVTLLYFALVRYLRQRWLLIGLVLLPISLTFTFWSVSGLENALYAFLITLSVLLLIKEEEAPTCLPVGSALSLVLVGMTRPEGLLYALAGLAYKVVQWLLNWKIQDERPLRFRNLLIWCGVFLVGYGLFKAWHWWYFAAWWPNPIYAKAGWYGTDLARIWFDPGGWVYLRGYFRTYGATWIIPLLLFGGLVSLRGPQKIFLIFSLAALALPLYTPDWMINYRFVYPFLPFEIALVILAGDQLLTWLVDKQNRTLWKRAGAALLLAWFAFGVARFTWANLRLSQRQLSCSYQTPMAETLCTDGKMYWSMGEVDQKYQELSRFARQIGLQDGLFMIPDIGATSYLQNLRILDLAGLADYHLARIRESPLMKQYIFQEQRPDFILTHGAWTRRSNLAAYSAFWENYLPIEQGNDRDGLAHGTFIRRDLILKSLDETLPAGTEALTELAPGMFLAKLSSWQAESTPSEQNNISKGLDLYWYAASPQAHAWNQRVRLVAGNGQILFERVDPLGYGWLPTTQWTNDEVLRQYLSIPTGSLPGNFTLEVDLLDEQGQPATSYPFRQELKIRPDPAPIQPTPENTTMAELLTTAQTQWQAGDLTSLLEVTRKVAALRGRSRTGPGWQNFSRQLMQAARQAQSNRDRTLAYQVALAATLADPNNAHAQRALEAARRLELLGEQATGVGGNP